MAFQQEQNINRSFIQMMVKEMADYLKDWDDFRKNNYSHFFDLCASVLSIQDRLEFDAKILEMEKKYSWSLMALENITHYAMNFAPSKRLVLKKRIPNALHNGWDLITRQVLNWHEIQHDLRKLRFWVIIKVQQRCTALSVDFSRISEITKTPMQI